MGKAVLEICGAVLSLGGVVIGVYGTYLLTKWYHPYTTGGFIKSLMRMLWRQASRQMEADERKQKVAIALAEMRPENKAVSLSGIYWVFFGFVLQTIGAILITINAILINVGHHVPD